MPLVINALRVTHRQTHILMCEPKQFQGTRYTSGLTNVTITCGIQPTGIVTMVMEVLHNSCNMCIHDLPDMYALNPCASGIHIRSCYILQLPYNGNCPQKKKFTNFMNLEAFVNVFLHFISRPEFLYMRLPESRKFSRKLWQRR